MRRLTGLWTAALAVFFVVVTGAGAGPAPQGADTLGPPERRRVTFGIRLPNLGSVAPIYIGTDKGFYRDEGFEEVKVITTEQVREGAVGGSLDFGVAELGVTVEAMQRNVPLVIIAAWRNYERFNIAVRREIASARDLDGKPVLLGGTPGDPNVNLRLQFLREVGWDLSTVRPNYAVVPGGSDTWVRLFLEGRLVMTYFFPRHKESIEQAGHRILVLKRLESPNDLIIVTEEFLAKNPNTATRFLRATLKAMAVYKDPANKGYVLSLMDRSGFRVTEVDRRTYEEGTIDQYDADMAVVPNAVFGLLKRLGFADAPKFERIANLFYLRKAWKSLGIPPRQ